MWGLTRTAVFLLCLTCCPGLAASQAIHLINVADTTDTTIGQGTTANSKLVGNHFKSAAIVANISEDEQRIAGVAFGCASIRAKLGTLKVQPADVVVFWYSGHGYRFAHDASAFPRLFCSGATHPGGPPSDTISLADVAALIAKLKPKLAIIVADTCNVVLPISPGYEYTEARLPASTMSNNIKRLFLKSSGVLIITSSLAGQSSWYRPSGGLFTDRFLTLLDDETDPNHAGDWSHLLSLATGPIMPADQPGVMEMPRADQSHLQIAK